MREISINSDAGATGLSRRAGFLTVLCTVAVCLAGSLAQAAGEGISVDGNRLLKDGQLWIPKGFTLVAFVAPERAAKSVFKEAKRSFGPELLDRARGYGADLLRFQVSQAGLDPQSSIYDPAYLDQILGAVHMAREKGFNVIVSMQWEPPSGLEGQPMMPSDITRRAWAKLAGPLGNDKYVMLELFNEPGMWEKNPQAWPTWQSGMGSLIEIVRKAGAQNTVLLDGIHGAHYLKEAPAVEDPLHKIAYATHPYINDKQHGPADWDRDFGNWATHHPVLVSEWNATPKLSECLPDMPQISREFIAYLKERKIGMVLWALDIPDTLFDKAGKPLEFAGFKCGVYGAGVAHIAIEHFQHD